jgi:hypothetical protein
MEVKTEVKEEFKLDYDTDHSSPLPPQHTPTTEVEMVGSS